MGGGREKGRETEEREGEGEEKGARGRKERRAELRPNSSKC